MLRQAITAYQFSRQIVAIREPFDLICGYGDAGSKLIKAMRRRMMLATVVEIQQGRVDALALSVILKLRYRHCVRTLVYPIVLSLQVSGTLCAETLSH